MATFKRRIRQLTRRSGGRSMEDVAERLRSYVLGWKAYFRLAQTPRVWKELDQWLRHRVRAVQLKSGSAAEPSTGRCWRWEPSPT
jgi:RNA-directed DNA polymerase